MSESTDPPEIENTDEGAIFVVDPDDYQRTKKLEAIHNARQQVKSVRQDRPVTSTEMEAHHQDVATAVADYGTELLPIIEDALEQGVLEDDDLETKYVNVRQFVACDGRIPDHDTETLELAAPAQAMAVYRQLDRILRKLGLGLELQEDKGPAQI